MTDGRVFFPTLFVLKYGAFCLETQSFPDAINRVALRLPSFRPWMLLASSFLLASFPFLIYPPIIASCPVLVGITCFQAGFHPSPFSHSPISRPWCCGLAKNTLKLQSTVLESGHASKNMFCFNSRRNLTIYIQIYIVCWKEHIPVYEFYSICSCGTLNSLHFGEIIVYLFCGTLAGFLYFIATIKT